MLKWNWFLLTERQKRMHGAVEKESHQDFEFKL